MLIGTLSSATIAVEPFQQEEDLRHALTRGRLDLLILAWIADGFDSTSLLQWLRDSQHPTSPVLVLNGDDSVEDAKQALELGVDDYIITPFRPI